MFVSSKDVAEVMGKRHDNLLRAIRKANEMRTDFGSHYAG